jgi:hypothetical protein
MPLSHADRLDPHAVFPDMRSRSLNKRSISKNVPDRNPYGLRLHANTRLVGVCAFFKQFMWLEAGSGKVALSRPTHQRVTQAVGRRLPIQHEVKELISRRCHRRDKTANLLAHSFRSGGKPGLSVIIV